MYKLKIYSYYNERLYLSQMSGQLIISLDFELLWGVRDHADKDSYGKNILGARNAIPQILELFSKYDIHATWATVGFLFCETKDELMECLPSEQPEYANMNLSNYSYFGEVGNNEKLDPYYFAPSLIAEIYKTNGQEIGTHTFSHYYCLEDGQKLSSFESDLIAATTLGRKRGIDLKSIVFPRNQFNLEHLKICRKHGITHFRGNPKGWAYTSVKTKEQTLTRRAMRLIDAHTGILGSKAYKFSHKQKPVNVPASRFLRPCSGKLAKIHPLHISIIKQGMKEAAKRNAIYHLWWHPHNFGNNLNDNLNGLKKIVKHFTNLKDLYGMKSKSMGSLT